MGVCSREHPWDLNPGDKKWYLDWLFVRGVNMMCPHAFYYSVEGERRSHERPPDVGPNNHWWPYYSMFSTYMKRLSWLMTDSVNQTEIAALCEEDHLPWKIVKPLYEHQIEFNYLEEDLFVHQSTIENGSVSIAEQMYSVLLVEDPQIITKEALEKLTEFINSGGFVIGLHINQEEILKDARSIDQVEDVIEALPEAVKQEVVLKPSCSFIRASKIAFGSNRSSEIKMVR